MRSIIHSIVLHDPFGAINPFNLDEEISEKLRKELHDAGVKTNKELNDYFRTEQGLSRFRKSIRSFKVNFRSGEVRTVYPYEQRSVQYKLPRVLQRRFLEARKKILAVE